MSLKKFGNWAGDQVSALTGASAAKAANKAADASKAEAARTRAIALEQADAMKAAQGRASDLQSQYYSQAMQGMNPYLMQGSQYANQLSNMLMGDVATQDIPGYSSMIKAREEGLQGLAGDLAGGGMLFSGPAARAAADLSGGMEQQLRSDYTSRLANEAANARAMQSNAANMMMGQGANLGNLETGGAANIANLMMQGQGMAGGFVNQAGQQAVQGQQLRQQGLGDLVGAGALLMGGM